MDLLEHSVWGGVKVGGNGTKLSAAAREENRNEYSTTELQETV